MLKSLNPNELPVLKTLIAEYLEELCLTDRSTVDYVLGSMKQGIDGRSAMVFLDNLETPALFVWAVFQKSALLDQKLLLVPAVFITKEKRGNGKLVENIMETISLAAHFNGCHMIYGGEWKSPPLPGAAKMWLKSGFREQEAFYVREV